MENVVKQCHVNVTLFLQVNHHHRQRDDQTKSQSWRHFKIKIEDQIQKRRTAARVAGQVAVHCEVSHQRQGVGSCGGTAPPENGGEEAVERDD